MSSDLSKKDRELLRDAVAFYLSRVTFATGDEAEGEYRRLLTELTEEEQA